VTPFAQYFDDVAVINLKSRPDRRQSILHELKSIGFSPDRVRIPDAPICEDDGGFPSRGVYGNYLSHIQLLRGALERSAKRVLILEDDAIFSRKARSVEYQARVLAEAEKFDWATWHLGHKLRRQLRFEEEVVLPCEEEFHWAHCYAVQKESIASLLNFLELIMTLPPEDPRAGKMYIDGALYHYRAEATDKPCLISNPALSIQKGSDSNLAGPVNPGFVSLARRPRQIARYLRDEFWRWSDIDFR